MSERKDIKVNYDVWKNIKTSANEYDLKIGRVVELLSSFLTDERFVRLLKEDGEKHVKK